MIIVRTVSRILFPVIILFGIYIASQGHLGPGGAFPGGVIVASAFLLLYLTHPAIAFKEWQEGKGGAHPAKMVRFHNLVTSIAAIGIAGLILAGIVFLTLVPEMVKGTQGAEFSALTILMLNVGGTLAVAAGLTLAVVSFLPRRIQDD